MSKHFRITMTYKKYNRATFPNHFILCSGLSNKIPINDIDAGDFDVKKSGKIQEECKLLRGTKKSTAV